MGALAQVQRELAEIVATPTRISLYGDGVRVAAPGDPWLISDFPNFRLTTGANQHYSDLVPSLRGALRNVINAGRDAVDAAARVTNGADAYGQVVSFWRPNAGVKPALRSAGDGVKQAWSPGRARSKP